MVAVAFCIKVNAISMMVRLKLPLLVALSYMGVVRTTILVTTRFGSTQYFTDTRTRRTTMLCRVKLYENATANLDSTPHIRLTVVRRERGLNLTAAKDRAKHVLMRC